jgi:hypothetical protein
MSTVPMYPRNFAKSATVPRHLAGVLVCMMFAAAPVAAAPSLSVVAEQYQSPAQLNLSPVQLWDTEWWLMVEARPDGAPLERLEYRTRFLDERPQSKAGGLSLPAAGDSLGGRVEIVLPGRIDYDRRLEARLRVYDTQGKASEWVVVHFPPNRSIRPADPERYVVQVDPADTRFRKIGTVEAEATESTRLSAVRDDLERQARAAGGDAAVGLRLVRSTADTFVFAADVVRYLEAPQPTATMAPKITDHVLGTIVIPYETR